MGICHVETIVNIGPLTDVITISMADIYKPE